MIEMDGEASAHVTGRDEALSLAEIRLQALSEPLISDIERRIQNDWLGPPNAIKVRVTDYDVRVRAVVQEIYEAAGWQVQIDKANASYGSYNYIYTMVLS